MSPSRTLNNVRNADLTVAPEGMAHLLENIGADAPPAQQIRELTANGIDALERTSGPGKILWAPDKVLKNKLTITDNGDGMTGPEMVEYINKLTNSASKTSLTDHFGMGSRITAGVRNPRGLVYELWKDGEYARIHFWKNPETGRYGLKPLEKSDGTFDLWTDVPMSSKPGRIINQHGTKITLLGRSEDDDTTIAPNGGFEFTGPDWISRYLSSRYTQFPANVDVRVSTKPTSDFNGAESVKPRLNYLSENSLASGTVELTNVNAHWFLLRSVKANTPVEGKGHVGVLYQNELYDTAFRRPGAVLLTQAGVIAGPDRVVLYFEPISKEGHFVKAATARSGLRIEFDQPSLTDWAMEFSDHMPEPLQQYMAKMMEEAPEDAAKRLETRLKRLHALFRSAAYRNATNGNLTVEPDGGKQPHTTSGEKKQSGGSGGSNGGSQEGKKRTLADRLKEKAGGDDESQNGKKGQDLNVPEIVWVDGKHDEQLKDCAAKYEPSSHKLVINDTFRGFRGLLSHMKQEYIDPAAPNRDVERFLAEYVKDYYSQILVEAIWGVLNLSEKGAYLPEEYIKNYLTPQGLTMAVQAKSEIRDNVATAMRHKGFRMRATDERAYTP